MRRLTAVMCAVLFGLSMAGTASGDEAGVSREREMLRRAQEALRQMTAERDELARSKLEAEQKLGAAGGQLAAARGAARSAASDLQARLDAAAATQADTSRRLDEATQQIQSLTLAQRETEQRLGSRDSELKQTRDQLQASDAVGTACEDKNRKLYRYSEEILDRYRRKGLWASMAQKEPVFGLGGVSDQNVVQEYRDKLRAERVPASAQEKK